jgi:hypothetical protein
MELITLFTTVRQKDIVFPITLPEKIAGRKEFGDTNGKPRWKSST